MPWQFYDGASLIVHFFPPALKKVRQTDKGGLCSDILGPIEMLGKA